MKYLNLIYIVVGISIGVGLTLGITKAVKPQIKIPACPPCNCPPSTEVKLQSMEMEALRKVKGNLTISNSLDHVNIYVLTPEDSVRLIKFIQSKNDQ